MAKRLNETLGAVAYDNVVNGAFPGADLVHVKLEGGATLKKGTLITGTPGGIMTPVSAALDASKITYILAHDTAAAVATAYRTGRFTREKLITADGYTLTEADAKILRKMGIFVDSAFVATAREKETVVQEGDTLKIGNNVKATQNENVLVIE